MTKNTLYRIVSTCILAIAVATFIASPIVVASTYVDVGDHVYAILSRLEAEGVIKSALLTTKPLSRKECARLVLEAEQNAKDKSPFIKRYVKILKNEFKAEIDGMNYVKPVSEVNVGYIHADEAPSELSYNNDGDDYDDGTNLRANVSSRAELGWLSFYLNPEVQYSDSNTHVTMKKAYGVLDVFGWELQAGSDSQWWGPGYHGSILLSNNPEPLNIIKITNTRPVVLPWLFKYLGLFKVSAFVTQLEESRVVPEPYLYGIRFNFKPSPYVEIGIHKTAMLGGKGRSESFTTWWKSFLGREENDPNGPGNQLAGYDVKVTVPWKVQPFQLYLDSSGEDEAAGLPSRWAFLYGVYLPRILDFERLEFRAEYAENHVGGHPNYWYNHFIYQSGYSYKSRIIGHHMGTDSEDLLFEMSYLIPEINGRISIGYDMKEHNLSGHVREEKDELYISTRFDISEAISFRAACAYGKVKDFGNIPGNDEDINMFIFQMSYKF